MCVFIYKPSHSQMISSWEYSLWKRKLLSDSPPALDHVTLGSFTMYYFWNYEYLTQFLCEKDWLLRIVWWVNSWSPLQCWRRMNELSEMINSSNSKYQNCNVIRFVQLFFMWLRCWVFHKKLELYKFRSWITTVQSLPYSSIIFFCIAFRLGIL